MTMARIPLVFMLVFALPHFAAAAPIVVVTDTFADGEHATLNPPSSAQWADSNGSDTLSDGAVTSGQGSFTITPTTGNSSTITAYYTTSGQPLTLGVGDTMVVKLRLSFTGLNSNTSVAQMRGGIFDSNGNRTSFVNDSGYGFFFSWMTSGGSSNPFAINRRTTLTSTNLFSASTDFTQIGSTGGGTYQNLANSTDYTFTYTVFRQSSTSTVLTNSLSGGSISGNYSNSATESSSTPNTAFDFLAFRWAKMAFATTITVKSLEVDYTPAIPVISAQPTFPSGGTSLTLATGSQTNITMTATGNGTTYQWFLNGTTQLADGTLPDGTVISGSATATLSLSNLQTGESGNYTVVVTNAGGNVTSNAVTLTVTTGTPDPPPVIQNQPASEIVGSGDNATFSVNATGSNLTYQWYLNTTTALSGQTGTTLTLTGVQASNVGNYTVVVTNDGGNITSNIATLSVLNLPPTQTALAGTNTYFVVQAAGTGLSYVWMKGNQVVGTNSNILQLSNVQASDAGSYTITVTDSFNATATSNAAVLTVQQPAATLPPQPVIPQTIFNVTTFGAKGDGTSDNASAIQSAIAAANSAGGGIVEIPAATQPYMCGPITIGSNTNLQVDYGATLQALPFGTYPDSSNNPSNLVLVSSSSTNVEISGQGTIDGNGAAWWAAFNSNGSLNRPRLIEINSNTNKLLITGVNLTNPAMFHIAFSNTSNVTLYGITINTSSTSPNTDGIDPAGSHYLIQGCNISTGDDNIAVKPQSTLCTDLTIANCTFGTGHGLSIGGQTNTGLDGMTVMNCTFNGTLVGIKMKADATQGGPVANVTYSNLTMTNVPSPIVFYSYYNQNGTPGSTGVSNAVTTTTASNDNSNPPNSLSSSTLPSWKNITISNLTATNASAYSIIWGLPLANNLISNITLNNVVISGGAGFKIYDASNVQITGNTSVGSYTTYNSLSISSQPQSLTANAGANTTFTASTIGASGVNNTAPTYRWNLNGTSLNDGTLPDGTVVSGSATTTLQLSNIQVAEAGSYTMTASNSLDGYNTGNNTLVPGNLTVSATTSAATLTVIPPYAVWANSFGLNIATTGAQSANPSGDGIPNLIKYALGGNPLFADRIILPTTTFTTINNTLALVFQFNRNTAAATALTSETVESSPDMLNWTTAVDGQSGVSITITPVDSSTQQVTVTIPFVGNIIFARLRVTP